MSAPRRRAAPTLGREQALLAEGRLVVAGSDEVGRGPLAGPVTVGVVAVGAVTGPPPSGLRDSKLLAPAAREALVPRIEEWAQACAVGHASATEIDRYGILRALRLAGERALVALGLWPDAVLLDGGFDWLTRPRPAPESPLSPSAGPSPPRPPPPVGGWVVPGVKADLSCASVAAASVLAKVARDRIMVELDARHPGYGWSHNKGYATSEHRAALRALGPCPEHRRTWRLGMAGADGQLALGLDPGPDLASGGPPPGEAAWGGPG